MAYKVLPFVANIQKGQGAEVAADQLAHLINGQLSSGWRYQRMESLEIIVTDPGDKGCFGFGARPSSQQVIRYDMVVFETA